MDLENELKELEVRAQAAINKRKQLMEEAGALEVEIVKFQGEYRMLKKLQGPTEETPTTPDEKAAEAK